MTEIATAQGFSRLDADWGVPPDMPLPDLRDDISLRPGPRGSRGVPSWTLFDPVRHRHHRLTPEAMAFLTHWSAGTIGALQARVEAETTITATAGQIEQFIRFLRGQGLVVLSGPEALDGWRAQIEAGKQSAGTQLLHNYLFFRIPLVRPDRFLAWSYPFIAPLYHARTVIALGIMLALGLYLVSQQWDHFVGGLAQFGTVEGLVWTAFTLVLTKVLHELGHAYTAHRYGCRVPTMGVAFMVLFPVLYTDTTDSWRLTDRRARLAIGAAGVSVELSVAVMATLMWSFLPESALREAVFIIATASWVTTLVINLSPFMRFDGYYLLSDFWDIPNLQERAFAVTRWWLREALFGLGEPMPEPWPTGQRRWLITYAVTTWIYRLILFIGIALLVYHFFIKVVGIALFVIELVWFVGRPIWKEVCAWWDFRDRIVLKGRTAVWLSLFLLVFLVLAVPLRGSMPLGAILQAEQAGTLHTPVPAQIREMLVSEGDRVVKDQPLVIVHSPALSFALEVAQREAAMARWALLQATTGGTKVEDRLVLEGEVRRLEARLAGLLRDEQRLILRSPTDGVVTDRRRGLVPGRWIAPADPLVTVATPTKGRIVAYADPFQVPRIEVGAVATFYPDDPLAQPIDGRVVTVAPVNIASLPDAMLSVDQGGPIAVRPGTGNEAEPVPIEPRYQIDIDLVGELPDPAQVRRGVIRIEGEAMSVLSRAWRSAAAVFIRESGF